MTIPKDHEFFPKVMESVQDGKEHSIAEIKEYCVTNSNFTKEQLDQRYPKSGDFVLLDRIGWAIAELKAAGLLEIPNRGMYKITEIGKEILTKHPENLTRKYLHQYGKYKIFAENYIKNKDLLRNKFGVDLNQNLNLTEENGLNFADERKNMIPAYHKFYHKVMESVEDGKEHSIKEIKNYCATTSNFTEEELSEYKDFVLSDDKILCYTCLFCTHKGIYEVDCDLKGHVDVHGTCHSYTKKELQ